MRSTKTIHAVALAMAVGLFLGLPLSAQAAAGSDKGKASVVRTLGPGPSCCAG